MIAAWCPFLASQGTVPPVVGGAAGAGGLRDQSSATSGAAAGTTTTLIVRCDHLAVINDVGVINELLSQGLVT